MTRPRSSTVRRCRAHRPDSFLKTLVTALLIENEPMNLQAQSLSMLIDKAVTRGSLLPLSPTHSPFHLPFTEGYIGMALAGGVAAVGTLLVAGLIRRATRK